MRRVSSNREESPTLIADKSSIAYGTDGLYDPLARLTGWNKDGAGEAELNEGQKYEAKLNHQLQVNNNPPQLSSSLDIQKATIFPNNIATKPLAIQPPSIIPQSKQNGNILIKDDGSQLKLDQTITHDMHRHLNVDLKTEIALTRNPSHLVKQSKEDTTETVQLEMSGVNMNSNDKILDLQSPQNNLSKVSIPKIQRITSSGQRQRTRSKSKDEELQIIDDRILDATNFQQFQETQDVFIDEPQQVRSIEWLKIKEQTSAPLVPKTRNKLYRTENVASVSGNQYATIKEQYPESPRFTAHKFNKCGKVDLSQSAYIFADKSEKKRISYGEGRLQGNIDQGKWTLVADPMNSTALNSSMIVTKNSFKTTNVSNAVSPGRATAIKAYQYSKFSTNRDSQEPQKRPSHQIRYLKKGIPIYKMGTSQNIAQVLSLKSGLSDYVQKHRKLRNTTANSMIQKGSLIQQKTRNTGLPTSIYNLDLELNDRDITSQNSKIFKSKQMTLMLNSTENSPNKEYANIEWPSKESLQNDINGFQNAREDNLAVQIDVKSVSHVPTKVASRFLSKGMQSKLLKTVNSQVSQNQESPYSMLANGNNQSLVNQFEQVKVVDSSQEPSKIQDSLNIEFMDNYEESIAEDQDTHKMDLTFKDKFRVISVFEEKPKQSPRSFEDLDAIHRGTLTKLRCSKQIKPQNQKNRRSTTLTSAEKRGLELMDGFSNVIDKRTRQEEARLLQQQLGGKFVGPKTDRDYEDFEQEQKSQGMIDSNELHQQDMKRLMYHVLKKKYEQFIYSPKSGEAKSLKSTANYFHKIKVVKNSTDARRQSVQDSLAVKSIVGRTNSTMSMERKNEPTKGRQSTDIKPRKHVRGFVDYERQIQRPELGSKCGLMPDQCAKDLDFHYEEVYGKNWTIEHQNYDFGKQLVHGHNKFDVTNTLQYKKNKPEQKINYNKIFRKFQEHEIERIINENLKHQFATTEDQQGYEDYIKDEMMVINSIVFKKICSLGKNVNELTDWFYHQFGLDPELFEIPRSKRPNFK